MKNMLGLNGEVSAFSVTIKVNGKEVSVTADQSTTLNEILRKQLHLTGAGVNHGYDDCHMCAVLVNGDEVCSNQLGVMDAVGKEIITVEGLLIEDDLEQLQRVYFNSLENGTDYSLPGHHRDC